MSWLAPFVTLIVVLALYLASGKGSARQAGMRTDINFYMVCVMAVAIVAIIAGARFGHDWLDVGVWVVAGVACAAVLWRWRGNGGVAGGE